MSISSLSVRVTADPAYLLCSWSTDGQYVQIIKWRSGTMTSGGFHPDSDWAAAPSHQLPKGASSYAIAGIDPSKAWQVRLLEAQFLPGALMQIVPAPPLPSDRPLVTFAVRRYGQSLQPADLQRVAGGIIWVQADAAGVAVCNQVKGATPPAARVGVYTSLNCVNQTDLAGLGTIVPYSLADQHESWFLHRGGQTKAHRVPDPGAPIDWLLDLGNPELQAAAVAHLADIQKLAPWDLWFGDNAWSSARQLGGPTDEWATDADVQAGFVSMLAKLTPSLDAPMIANFGGDALAPLQTYLRYLAGYFQESWTDGNRGVAQQLWNTFFQMTVTQLNYAQSTGQIVDLHSYCSGRGTPPVSARDSFMIALCAMLLFTDGSCLLELSTTDYSTSGVYYPECDLVRTFVTAVSAATVSGTLHVRQFLDDKGRTWMVTLDTGKLTWSIS